MLSRLFERTLLQVADRGCLVCGQGQQALCEPCGLSEVAWTAPACMICNKTARQYQTCSGCRRNFPLHHIYAAAIYEGRVRDLVIKVKAASSRYILADLASVVAEQLRPLINNNSTLLPLPSSAQAQRQRGFDSASALARHLSEHWDLPVAWSAHKISNHQQKQLNLQQRLATRTDQLHRFDVRALPDDRSRPIILVDDIMTTGSTLASAARQLRALGFKQVDAVVLARGPWQ